ncbi:MAG: hypothetical protein ACI9VR_004168 [Cognaticolwellia sp.]|jgi:hypothetical protein
MLPEDTGFQDLSVGRANGFALADDGSIACWGKIDAPPSQSGFARRCTGPHHAIAVGFLACLGANDNGQSDPPSVDAVEDHARWLKKDTLLTVWTGGIGAGRLSAS